MTFRIVTPIDLRPMAATGVPPDDVVIALTLAAAAMVVALMFGGGGLGVCKIVVLLRESWV